MHLNPELVPDFIAASNPKKLRKMMLLNNARNGLMFKYYQIVYNPDDKKWYAWYHRPLANSNALFTEILEEIKEDGK